MARPPQELAGRSGPSTGASGDLRVQRTAQERTPAGGEGVSFPLLEGRRSTTATGRAILADAADAIDIGLGVRIRACDGWRDGYGELLRELTAACGGGEEDALAVASAGLGSMRERLTFERAGTVTPLGRALDSFEASREYGVGSIEGVAHPLRELRVPYRGRELSGPSLGEQLERWVDAGIVEPSFAEAIEIVAANPDWLSLPGRTVALIGAGAELSPLPALCAWGARVAAVDLPDPATWGRVLAIAKAGAGTLTLPVTADGSCGADVRRELPEMRRWFRSRAEDDELVLGMYAYLDGGAHVTVTGAFDALVADALTSGWASGVAFLGTPTDAYLVPAETALAAREAYAARRVRRVLQGPLQVLSGGRLFAPAYAREDRVADILVKQQGPNYALAKRLQRWRASLARYEGRAASFNVAPASWTRSVTHNRILAAAYASAHRHGVEVFSAETTRVLMAALLVHDLHVPGAVAGNPEAMLSERAAHGGLWRAAYEPRSVLGFAALVGLPSTLVGRAGRG